MTQSKASKYSSGQVSQHGVLAGAYVFSGAMALAKSATGFLFTNDGTTNTLANGDKLLGVTRQEVDNTLGSSGDINCEVYQNGEVEVNVSDTLDGGDIGAVVYLNNTTDDGILTITPVLDAPELAVGKIVKVIGANVARIKFDGYIGNEAATTAS